MSVKAEHHGMIDYIFHTNDIQTYWNTKSDMQLKSKQQDDFMISQHKMNIEIIHGLA